MRILVTGDAGFIGTHLRGELLDAGHEVYGIDIVTYHAAAAAAAGAGHLFRGRDLLDRTPGQTSVHLDDVIDRYSPHVVVHLAAQVGRLFGEDDLEHTISSNALMTSLVARSCAGAAAPPRLVYTSTSEVYGDLGDRVAHEDDGVRGAIPHNLYGLSKRWGEEASAMAMLAGEPETSGGLQVIRPSMPYGPGLPAGRGRAAIVNMIWQAQNRQPIPVHRGSERSWCWIGDTVRAIRLVIETGEVAYTPDAYVHGWGCYNVGRDDAAVPMTTVAEIACDLASVDPADLVQVVEAPARQTVVKRLSTAKLADLGWEPRVELREGMERTLLAMRDLGQLAV